MDVELTKLLDQYEPTLNRDIQGKVRLPSQQSATGDSGTGDANTNLNIHENAKMKEQQRSVVVNQEQGLKLSSQQAHVVQQPVGPVNHGPSPVKISEFLGILFAQVDENGKRLLRILYDKFKRNELTKDAFLKQMKNVVGDPMIILTMKLLKLRQQTMGIKAPGCSSNSRVSSTSAGMTDSKFKGTTSVNGLSKVQGGPISHFQNNSALHLYSAPQKGSVTKEKTVSPLLSVVHVKQEQLDQILDQAQKPLSLVEQAVSNVPMNQNNGNPRRSNDELEQKSSKKILTPSSTNTSFVSPSMTTQLESSTMVDVPGPSGTILGGANVLKTAKLPSIGHKKPLDVLDSSLSPSRKKQKVCSSSSHQSMAQLNDVTAGVNLEEEEQLLFCKPKKDGHVSEASLRIVHKEKERMILQKIPLQRKLAAIMAQSGLNHMSSDVEWCLSLYVEERMRGLLSNIIRVSKQRTDVEKSRNRTFITSDIRKHINKMNQKMKEELERKQAEEKDLKNGTENEDNRSKKEEENKREAEAKEEKDKMRAKAANVAARAAIGGNDAFLKWKLMAEDRQKQSSGTGKNSKKPCAEADEHDSLYRNDPSNVNPLRKNQGCSPKVARSISVKDVINVVEKEPQMSKSTLLYRLYNRIGSDVQTQESI